MPCRIPQPFAALLLAGAPLSAQQAPAANGWDPQLFLRTSGADRKIAAPAGTTILSTVWSLRETHVAYLVNFLTASYVQVLDVASGRSPRLTERPLPSTLVTDVDFTADGRHVVAVVVPSKRGAEPVLGGDGVADGP
jgi:hypothetical protein